MIFGALWREESQCFEEFGNGWIVQRTYCLTGTYFRFKKITRIGGNKTILMQKRIICCMFDKDHVKLSPSFCFLFLVQQISFPIFRLSCFLMLSLRKNSVSHSSFFSHAIFGLLRIISSPLPFPTVFLSTVSTQGIAHLAYVTPLLSCAHVDFRSPDFASTCAVFLTSNANFSHSRQTNRIILAPIP